MGELRVTLKKKRFYIAQSIKRAQIPSRAFTDTRIKKGCVIRMDGITVGIICKTLKDGYKVV